MVGHQEGINQGKITPQLVIGVIRDTNNMVIIKFSYEQSLLDAKDAKDAKREITMRSRVAETGREITTRFVQIVTLDGMKYISYSYTTRDKGVSDKINGCGLAKINPSTGLVINTIAFSQSNGVSSSIDVLAIIPFPDALFPNDFDVFDMLTTVIQETRLDDEKNS